MKNNNVLIKEHKENIVSNAGIVLPNEKYNRKATVVLSGSPEISVGDLIIKTIGNGTAFNIDGNEYEIIHDSHILAIIK